VILMRLLLFLPPFQYFFIAQIEVLFIIRGFSREPQLREFPLGKARRCEKAEHFFFFFFFFFFFLFFVCVSFFSFFSFLSKRITDDQISSPKPLYFPFLFLRSPATYRIEVSVRI